MSQSVAGQPNPHIAYFVHTEYTPVSWDSP